MDDELLGNNTEDLDGVDEDDTCLKNPSIKVFLSCQKMDNSTACVSVHYHYYLVPVMIRAIFCFYFLGNPSQLHSNSLVLLEEGEERQLAS